VLSIFDDEQQALLVAYRALCEAEPPEKRELRRVPRLIGEEMVDPVRNALSELSRSSGCVMAPSDWGRRGTRLPRHRDVVATRGRNGSLATAS